MKNHKIVIKAQLSTDDETVNAALRNIGVYAGYEYTRNKLKSQNQNFKLFDRIKSTTAEIEKVMKQLLKAGYSFQVGTVVKIRSGSETFVINEVVIENFESQNITVVNYFFVKRNLR